MHMITPVSTRAACCVRSARVASQLILVGLALTSCTAGLGPYHQAIQHELQTAPSSESPIASLDAADLGENLSRSALIQSVLERNQEAQKREELLAPEPGLDAVHEQQEEDAARTDGRKMGERRSVEGGFAQDHPAAGDEDHARRQLVSRQSTEGMPSAFCPLPSAF